MIEDGANRIDEGILSGTIDLAVTLNTERTALYDSCHFSTQRNVALLHDITRLQTRYSVFRAVR